MLTKKQRRFVEEYLIDMSETAAARRAGYAPRTCKQGALLRQPAVRAAIEKASAARTEKLGLDADRILLELYFLSTARLDYFETVDGRVTTRAGVDARYMAAVSSVHRRQTFSFDGSVKESSETISLWDKNKSLSLVMRSMGLLVDRLVLESPETIAKQMIAEASDEYDRLIGRITARKQAESKLKN